ncbi:MAG: flagellar basal body-associated FliL family protein [Desulfobacteraceae bacterium]|jgi:flagellar FliL protein
MSKKVIIIIIAVFVLLLAMMGGGFFLLWSQMSATVAQVQMQNGTTEASEQEQVDEQEDKMGPVYRLDTLIVNLADQGGKRYLRVTMELELKPNEQIDNSEVVEEIEQRLPQLRDTILMVLPTKQYADISTTPGKIALRDEIIAKLNPFLKKGQIDKLYFTEFVVQ